MLRAPLKTALFTALCVPILVSCIVPPWSFNSGTVPAPAQQFPGAFETLAINQYPEANSLVYSISNADAMAQAMKNPGGWTQIQRLTDFAVTAQSFSQYETSIDFLLFDGHGSTGAAALSYAGAESAPLLNEWWSVGSTDGVVPQNPVGLPIQGRLKWIVMNSSDTVAAPSFVVPSNPAITANWSPAFGDGLHGLYGAWQSPGSCPGESGVTCDILDQNNADYLFQLYALPGSPDGSPSSGATVHDAWAAAVSAQNNDATWGIWEDASARDDMLSGPGDGSAPPSYASGLSGNLLYYFTTNPAGVNVTSVVVKPQTFSLNPRSLVNESINDSGLLAQYGSQSNQHLTASDNGSVYTASGAGGEIRHFYGSSGAVVYFSIGQDNPVAFNISAALTVASNYVSDTLGMPSDAVLSSELQLWKASPKTGSIINDGYEFIWSHASPVSGGDAIKVVVSDSETPQSHCDNWSESTPPRCLGWLTTYTNAPYVSSAYRLWRTVGSQTSSAQPPGVTSIDAVTASTALPPGALITAYSPELWTPDSLTSSTAGARSAWVFTLSGQTQIAVDAYTGLVLGSITLQ